MGKAYFLRQEICFPIRWFVIQFYQQATGVFSNPNSKDSEELRPR